MRAVELTLGFQGSSQSFECQRCGSCCHGNSRTYGVKLLYQEVRAIQRYLGEVFETRAFEDFVWDYCTFFSYPQYIGDPSFLQVFRESMEDFFFSVFQPGEEAHKMSYVEYYVLKTYRDSGRCIFFNPLEKNCLVHEVKPLVCQLYPYFAEIDAERNKVTMGSFPDGECQGLGKGRGRNIFHTGQKALALAGSLNEHYHKLAVLLREHDTETALRVEENFVNNLKYKLDEEGRGKVEEVEGREVRDLFVEEGLIKASREYLERINRE